MIGTSSSGITAPMNLNKVIAHLVDMTPPQRKQFAQLHMDDPMLLSAAKYVDNQISKQAAALSAQRTGAAPPPVNQQVVAQMSPQPPAPQAAPMPQAAPQQQAAPMPQGQAQPMPEDSGIAQLPAQNMPSEYAAGGIVAFNQGDLVRGMPVSAQTAAMYQEAGQTGTSLGTGIRESLQAAGASLTDAGTNYLKAKIERNEPLTGVEKAQAKRAGLTVPVAAAGKDYQPPRVNYPVTPTAPARNDKTKRDPTNYAPAKTPKEKTGIDQLRADSVESAPPSTAKATVTAAGEDADAMYAKSLKAQGDPRANLPPEIQANANLAKAQGEKELASADKREKGLKALMDERNTRLAGREKYAKDQEELNPNMSLITAGLAMMQSTGKGLAGLAEGATRGVAQYMEGVKYNSAQRQKLEDARDALADLKFNQENMTEKERLAAQNTITQGAIAANNAVITTIQHREGVNAQTAGRIFDANSRQALEDQRQQFEMGQQKERLESQERLTKAQMNNALRAAGISANAPMAAKLAFLKTIGAAPEDSDLYKGYLLTEQADKEPRMYEAYQKMATDEMKGPAFKQQFPTFESYKAGMSNTGGGGTMPNPNWKNYSVR